jgi:hypothetical protein
MLQSLRRSSVERAPVREQSKRGPKAVDEAD